MGHTPTSSFPTTDDALKLFVPGQKISLKPFDGSPEVSFTIVKLSIPVTKSIVVLAAPDTGAPEVVIKMFDPRYFDERILPKKLSFSISHPWQLVHEQAAAMARTENSNLSEEDLREKRFAHNPYELSGDNLVAHCVAWEEYYHRIQMGAYEAELKAYGRLKAFQGSVIPRLFMTGQFLPPDERAIQPPALVLEYIPSVSLYDVSQCAITPAIQAQLISAIESFALHGVIHSDLNLNNIRLAPPDNPVRGIVIDFALAYNRRVDSDEERWKDLAEDDTWWARRLLEDVETIKRPVDGARMSRFV